MTEYSEEYAVNPHHFLDSITKQVATVLLENPEIAYNQSTLAEAAGISRDALYRRWDNYKETGLIEEADVESQTTHWKLNSDSEITYILGKLLYDVLKGGRG